MADNLDHIDEFIVQHSKSMSQAEIARRVGVDKSTVSRRMKALRESGELDSEPARDSARTSKAERSKLKALAVDRGSRLEALDELRGILHRDLEAAGGQSLARVASEYRAVLAEMEALSTELQLTEGSAHELDAVDVILMSAEIWEAAAYEVDEHVFNSIVDGVLAALDSRGVVRYSPLTKVRVNVKRSKDVAGAELDATA